MAGSTSFEVFCNEHSARIEALYHTSGGNRWAVPLQDFAQAVFQGIASAAEAEPRKIPRLLDALHGEDLVLALGCALGNEPAWEAFCSHYRAVLYSSAYALARDEVEGRELADSLLAELYGLEGSEAKRNSRFWYFHGRSSLKTWLRAVLYQRFVDEYRRQSRLAPLPEDMEAASPMGSVSEQEDSRYADWLGEAVEAVLSTLRAPEKLLLGYYYVQELTLKQIGRLTSEHEATISRRLEGLRKKLRKRIEAHLRRVRKLSAFELDRCLDFAARGVDVKLEKVLKPE